MPREEITKFVVLFVERSGSTYLIEALDAHRDVRAQYELLSKSRDNAARQRELALRALQPPVGDSRRAHGFKVKYKDLGDQQGFAQILKEQQVRLLALRRRNLVKQTVSWINAERLHARTGDWNLYDRRDEVRQPLLIETDLFRERLNTIERHDRGISEYVERMPRPTLSIYYEDLVLKPEQTLAMAFGFLGVTPVAIEGDTVKSTDDDLSLSIANFEELKAGYVGTEREWMFDEVLLARR
jgi:LPS sulfotransferase NodH